MGTRTSLNNDEMPAEIDFSNGIRGKFAKPGTTLKLPVYDDSGEMTPAVDSPRPEPGPPAMPPADLDPATLRETLNQRLDELRQSIASTADSRKPVALDQASVGRLSRMDAMQMQAMAQAAERMRHREIARIEAALERLEAGDYGYCVTCGEAISEKRLATDPTIPTCITCASR